VLLFFHDIGVVTFAVVVFAASCLVMKPFLPLPLRFAVVVAVLKKHLNRTVWHSSGRGAACKKAAAASGRVSIHSIYQLRFYRM
jgi:hypothetical protein